ncbi:MAG: flagellar basal-body MS-ring/collar protein FliF [Syntrophobacteraceae bacterium]
MEAYRKYLEQLKTTYGNLSNPQKILSAGSLLILLGSLAYLLYSTNRTEYSPLFSELPQQEMATVVDALKAKKIPYKLNDGGGISVPKEQLLDVRLALAKDGLPKGPGAGFELFDQEKLGSSKFVQKINYQRALQGELARTIDAMDEVAESRVHLVMPEESVFIEDQKPASASVVLKLRPGGKIDNAQAQGIVHLIASAVQGLKEENITIMSTDGKVIYQKNGAEAPMQQMTNLQMETKKRMEEDLNRKVQSMMEQVLGSGKVITRVTADLDFTQTQIAEDTYDPDSAVVRSQQRSVESSEGKDGTAKGNPDVPINVESKLLESSPNAASGGSKDAGSTAQQNKFNRQRETVNYEINHVNRQIVRTPGSIKRLSVAVVVDGSYEMKPDKDGKMKPVFVGRTPEELKSFDEMVKKAVGYDEARGDQISISNSPFATDLNDMDMVSNENKWLKMLKDNQKMLFNTVLMILIFVFVIRPFMKKFQQIGEKPKELPAAESAAAPALPEGAAAAKPEDVPLLEEESPEDLPLRKQVALLIEKNPDRATEIIRAWLREEA